MLRMTRVCCRGALKKRSSNHSVPTSTTVYPAVANSIVGSIRFFAADTSTWACADQAASLLLFLGYTMSEASIEQQVKESPLFRGDSLVIQAFRDPAQPPGAGR